MASITWRMPYNQLPTSPSRRASVAPCSRVIRTDSNFFFATVSMCLIFSPSTAYSANKRRGNNVGRQNLDYLRNKIGHIHKQQWRLKRHTYSGNNNFNEVAEINDDGDCEDCNFETCWNKFKIPASAASATDAVAATDSMVTNLQR